MEDRNTFRGGEEKSGWEMKDTKRKKGRDRERVKRDEKKKIGLAFQIKDDILSEEGNEEILGKPVGNDKELEKCTYVSKYGLQGAKKILEEITKEAIEELKEYGDKAEFLRKLALYIKDRNK